MGTNMGLKYIAVLCLLLPAVLGHSPQLRRSLNKSGFHRELSTSIELHKSLLPDVTETGDISCQLLFTETIPSGAYVDPYQLASLTPFGGPDVLVEDKVDIEKPEYLSPALTVLVYTKIHGTGELWFTNYTLPVHLRYHATSDTEDFASVTFPRPEIALRCSTIDTGLPYNGYTGNAIGEKKVACDSYNQVLCNWTIIETSSDCDKHLIFPGDLQATPCKQDSITVAVPVGRSPDYYLVTGGTLLFTIGGCLVLGLYVVNKDHNLSKKLQ